jgi:ankyrin repeat protein
MRHYFKGSMLKQYNLSDIGILDQQIREELGEQYERSLLATQIINSDAADEDVGRFDEIYVSSAGHGLLHYSATFGKVQAMKHLLDTYKCDLDLGSTYRYDSPLVCAVRSAQYDCAMLLLERGAKPGKIGDGLEGPLHCLCGFETEDEEKISTLAKRLIAAGADIEELSDSSGSRGIAADWDRLLDISTTPLGRAVIARSNTAIKVLLSLGADPNGKGRVQHKHAMSPVEVAAMLFYPDVLQTLLQSMEVHSNVELFDEAWLLNAAHQRGEKAVDPSSRQNRLVRLGSRWKSAISDTFRLVRNWNSAHPSKRENRKSGIVNDDLLYKEVILGDADIIQALLELGHDPNGMEQFRPLQAAAVTRNQPIFELLLSFGADPHERYLFLPEVRLTFLHALAFPRQGARTPDGVKIAERLLALGIPVEETLEQCPITPFALCVMSRYFDIASLLLAHGADLNPVHAQLSGQEPPISLLGRLVSVPSEAALQSVRYLMGDRPPQPSEDDGRPGDLSPPRECHLDLALQISTLQLSPKNLSPVAVPSRQRNVLHVIAAWTTDKVSYDWLASLSIMEHMVTRFEGTTIIDELCPESGTPLIIAASMVNFEFVRLLLEKGANHSICLTPVGLKALAGSTGVQPLSMHCTPLHASLMIYEAILVKFENGNKSAVVNIEPLEDLITNARKVPQLLLPLSQDAHALRIWNRLEERRDKWLAATKRVILDIKSGEHQVDYTPVDLSALTEERPDGWSEGCEMTDEMMLRIFLRHFRIGTKWPDP